MIYFVHGGISAKRNDEYKLKLYELAANLQADSMLKNMMIHQIYKKNEIFNIATYVEFYIFFAGLLREKNCYRLLCLFFI